MVKNLEILQGCPLFAHIEHADLSAMLGCLGAKAIALGKNETVFAEGDAIYQLGIVLSGAVQIVKNDFFGNRSIVASIGPGQLFGESFACANVPALPVSVVTSEESEIMLIDCRRITRSCSNACAFHSQIVLNLLQVVAQKNLLFNRKMEILSRRSTRDKLMTYLMEEAKKSRSREFTIPFDRQALADYLGVERSALSAEISKLKKDGILDSERSRFVLLEAAEHML